MKHVNLKRRDFLRIVGVGSVAGLATYMLGRDEQPAYARVTETRLLMGTVVNLTLITDDPPAGHAAIAACLDHMEDLEQVLSRHQSESQLSRLNRDGSLDQADSHLVTVLREAVQMSVLTDGAFDVTVKPLIDLYADGVPSSDAVAAALDKVDYCYLNVQADRVAFSRSGMTITLDGIAKGYIVDEGVAILRQLGFQNTLVEAGGDLAASGRNPDHPWRIGIQSPRQNGNNLLHTFNVVNQAAATSGDYRQAYSDDFMAHHIVDPRTGRSAPELASVTVVASRAMVADALATALMVMDSAKGLALVESLADCEAYLVTKNLESRHSAGFSTA